MTEPDSRRNGEKLDARLQTGSAGATKEADWTVGLKRLYDSVLEEPMPDNFRNLLAKLDDDNNT